MLSDVLLPVHSVVMHFLLAVLQGFYVSLQPAEAEPPDNASAVDNDPRSTLRLLAGESPQKPGPNLCC